MLVYIGWSVILIGLYFIFTSILGLYRFPDFFTKVHATGISDSLGFPLCYIGMILINWPSNFSIKCLILIIFSFVIAPLNCHAMVQAILRKTGKL